MKHTLKPITAILLASAALDRPCQARECVYVQLGNDRNVRNVPSR